MTPKELAKLIATVVKKELREHKKLLKEEIRSAVRAEITSILEDAGKAKQLPEPEPNTSLSQLLSEEEVTGEAQSPMFQGKGKIYDVLNQTAQESKGRGQLIPGNGEALNEQKEFVFNTNNTPASTTGIPAADKASLAQKMGYGLPPVAPVPGNVTVAASPQSPATVQVPTTNADGKPINLNKVNPNVIQGMMRNYSGFLKKMDEKAKNVRGA